MATSPSEALPRPLRTVDGLWLLAYPIYQLLGTFRHESAHALVALLEGAAIAEFVFWPTFAEGGGIRWGYVRWQGEVSWLSLAAPYVLDLLTFALGLWICRRSTFKRRWIWLNVVVLTVLSPLANSLYNYAGGLRNGTNDVGRLLRLLPDGPVHAYFIVTLTLYVVGLVVLFRRRRKEW
ncbi:MAG: M50 family metallopeptidase [Anaerolineales bacterium]